MRLWTEQMRENIAEDDNFAAFQNAYLVNAEGGYNGPEAQAAVNVYWGMVNTVLGKLVLEEVDNASGQLLGTMTVPQHFSLFRECYGKHVRGLDVATHVVVPPPGLEDVGETQPIQDWRDAQTANSILPHDRISNPVTARAFYDLARFLKFQTMIFF